MGVLFGRGGLAPFFGGYKNKVGVYLNDPPPSDLIAQFSRTYFFWKGMNLTKTLVPLFYLWVHFWIFHGQKRKKMALQPRSTILDTDEK